MSDSNLMHPLCAGANPGNSPEVCVRCGATPRDFCKDEPAFDVQWADWLHRTGRDVTFSHRLTGARN